MTTYIFDIFLYIYFAVIILAAIFGTWYKDSLIYPLNWMFIYLWLGVFVELSVFALRHFKIPFMWAYNAFGPIEFFFISWLYIIYFKLYVEKTAIKITFLLYTFFVFYHEFYLKGFSDYNLIFLLRSMLTSVLTLYFFLKIFKSDEILEINKSPLFWLSIGLFIFCTTSLFSMGLGVHIIRFNIKIGYIVYLLNPILNIYLYIMFIVSFICSRRNPKYY